MVGGLAPNKNRAGGGVTTLEMQPWVFLLRMVTRHATSVRQGNWFSVAIGPVSTATR